MRGGRLALVLPILLGLNAPQARAAFTITPLYDSSITSDPNAGAIESAINAAIHVYETKFTNSATVNIQFQKMTTGLGSSSTYYGYTDYATYRAALTADKTTGDGNTAFLNYLPAGPNNPVNGNPYVDITLANARAIGFNADPPTGQPDSYIGLNTSLMNFTHTATPGKYDLFAVASHEIDEALGFGSALNGLVNGANAPTGAVWGLDLYRYSAPGVRSLTTDSGANAYFSVDGGATNLVNFNQQADGDFSDWYSTGPHTPQVQDAFGATDVALNLSNAELTGLDVLGYNQAPAAPEPAQTAMLGMIGIGLGGLLWHARRRCNVVTGN